MAREYRSYTCAVPAATPATTPVLFSLAMPPREVRVVEFIVPPGPSGVVGFALAMSGVRVIPYGSDLWIVTSDEKIVWPMDGYPNSGAWQLMAYNTGTVAHSIYVRFGLDLVGAKPLLGGGLYEDALLSDYGPADV